MKQTKKRYTTILLDADGTLLDYDQAELAALEATFLHYHIPYTDQLRDQYRTINSALWMRYEQGDIAKDVLQTQRFATLFEQLGLDISPKACNDTYLNHLSLGSQLLEGALSLCQQLHQGYQLAIITNGIASVQHQRLEGSGLLPYLSHVFISDEIGFQKPDVAFFKTVMDQMQLPSTHSALVVGDSLTADIQGGHHAGFDTCWFNPDRLPLHGSVQPTFTVASLQQLSDLLL